MQNIRLTTLTTGEEIIAESLQIKGIHIIPAVVLKNYIAEDIQIKNARIVLSNRSKKNYSGQRMRDIHLKNITLLNADFLIFNANENKNDSLLYGNFSMNVNDFRISENRTDQNGKIQLVSRIQFSVENAGWFLPGNLNKLELNKLDFDSQSGELIADSVTFFTRHTKPELAEITGVETDWYNLTLKTFEMQNIKLEAMFERSALVTERLEITDFTAEIFRDKRLPFPEKKDTKLPYEIIESLPIAFHCDSFLILDADIIYKEKVTNDYSEAEVTFNQMQVSISNLSNIESLIQGPTEMHASAKVMNSALLTARFAVPNKKFNNGYSVRGRLHPSEIDLFNPVIVPNASARINSGRIKTFDFNFNYTNAHSTGKLILEYENLKISFLNEDDGSKRKIKTLIANTFMVKEENLKGTKSYKTGTISFKRDKKKSVFNYWWKSIFSGIESISIV